MTNAIISNLCAGMLEANPLAIITRDLVIVKGPGSHTIIPLAHLTRVKRITTTYPGFLVVSAALSLLALACFCSKQGSGAGIPAAVLAGIFAAAFFLTRKAAISFSAGPEQTETRFGSLTEVAALIDAVRAAQDHTGSVE